ncbi:MAG: hypothetical protein M1475_08570 [Actinobacteria bacterium]|nr:hypothetical protein [Actinomycetota bacterium]MCL6088451.1 hypothetical protein [Actinomycetota bacterium]
MNKYHQIEISKNKKRVLNSISHKTVDKISLMYRAVPKMSARLLKYFLLDPDLNKSWKDLQEVLKIDVFSSGNGLGKFTKYFPEYIGKNPANKTDRSMFYAWGIYFLESNVNDAGIYLDNNDFAKLESIYEIKKYPAPKPEDFDFEVDTMKLDMNLKKDCFLGTGYLVNIFMISLYLRGIQKLMIELLTNKKLAKYYIDPIGGFAYEFTKTILGKIGKEIDFFSLWDDFAMQTGLMIPYDVFKYFYFPWYKKIFSLAKQYNLITYFHICGNVNGVIPDLIDMGVDILDPIQTSAKDMDLEHLKNRYGKNICFHGGIDVQHMLPFGKVKDIKGYVDKTLSLFNNEGGLILGPSHEITSDTPLENILAVYRPDLL